MTDEPEGGSDGDATPADQEQPDYFAGEHKRRVPPAAWWVLGVACVLLLSLLVVRPSWFTRTSDDNSLHVPADRHFTKTVDGLGHADGLWLNDDSPSSNFTVLVPVDSDRSQTRLHLLGDTQVPEDSTVFLSVSVDGNQVDRSELPRGDNSLDRIVGIPTGATADGAVRVQLRMDGELHNQTCSTDHQSGANIHIASDTVVEAALDSPIHTIRDVVSSWDHTITIVVPDSRDPWRTVAAQVGIGLAQAGHQVIFDAAVPDSDTRDAVVVGPDSALSPLGWRSPSQDPVAVGKLGDTPVLGIRSASADAATRLVTGEMLPASDGPGNDPRKAPASTLTGDDIALGDLGADLSTASITEDHTWRIAYSLADLPGGRLPHAVRAAWRLPASPSDLTWVLNTSLNGRLIDSRRLTGGPPPVITLPPALARVDNTVTFTVQRDRDLGGCDVRETKYSMAMDPSSGLLLGGDPGSGFVALPKILAPGVKVYVPTTGGRTVELLNAAVPVIADFVPAGVSPEFQWSAVPLAGQPFVQIGTSPGITTPVSVSGGRLVSAAPALDVSAIASGVIVSCGASGNAVRGLVVQPIGAGTAAELPPFGQESAQIITSHGSIAVTADGAPVPSGSSRANPPG